MDIIWTKRALKTYFRVSDYLQGEWGNTVVYNFAKNVESLIGQIKEDPHLFEVSKKYRNVRKGFVTKHNTLFYRVKSRKKEIELLLFWDNRQDDKKRPF